MKLNTLHDALVHELQDLLSAEKQLIKALPKVAKAASDRELKAGIEKHLEQTKEHQVRLEEALDLLGATKGREKCLAMEGLIEEGKKALEEEAEPEVLDVLIITISQKIEHYEIAGYGCACTYADFLGEKDVKKLLKKTMAEEVETDRQLSIVAERSVNQKAEALVGV
jgi:ferritin-like metal-binding protein YciE